MQAGVFAVVAALAALALQLFDWWQARSPERKEAQQDEKHQARMEAAVGGDVDALADDIERLRFRFKSRLCERQQPTDPDPGGADQPG